MKRLLATPLVIAGTVIALAGLGAMPANASSVIVVPPGGSIQDAVNAASPGTTIELRAGTYDGGVLVQKSQITIRGAGAATVLVQHGTNNCAALDPDAVNSGICVVGDFNNPGVNPVVGVRIESLTVAGFNGFGAVAFDTDKLRVEHVTASDNDEYGITAFASTRTRFTHDWVLNTPEEAGFYIGDIADAQGSVVSDNYASGNALGILVRHANNVKVTENTFVNNCVGVALINDGQPGGQGDTLVSENVIAHNNKVCPPSEEVPITLTGTGVLIFGGLNNTVTENKIVGNRGTAPWSGGVVLVKGGDPANPTIPGSPDMSVGGLRRS
jgi:parallel beta-helix repeat protein